MAYFGGMFNDQFFGDAHRLMRSQMDRMDQLMNQMMAGGPFGAFMAMPGGGFNGINQTPRQQMIDDGLVHNHGMPMPGQQQQQQRVQSMDGNALMPFGFGGMMGGGLMPFFGGGIGPMFQQLDQLQDQVVNDPNSHVITHSQVFSFNNMTGTPQYYEASNSVRKAGNVKETRKTVRDTRTGTEKMLIGHKIGDREHVVEKERDQANGEIKTRQQFQNIDETQAEEFDREWSHVTRRALDPRARLQYDQGNTSGHTNGGPRAIEDRNSPYYRSRSKSMPRTRKEKNPSSGPIIEEVE